MNNFLKNLDHFFRTRKEDSTFDDPPIEDPDPIDVFTRKILYVFSVVFLAISFSYGYFFLFII